MAGTTPGILYGSYSSFWVDIIAVSRTLVTAEETKLVSYKPTAAIKTSCLQRSQESGDRRATGAGPPDGKGDEKGFRVRVSGRNFL
jgi:hypothetical protein